MVDEDIEFIGEAEDLLEAARVDLAEWGDRADGDTPQTATVDRLFRHLHTLKGLAAAFDLDQASRLAHEVESLLDQFRKGQYVYGVHLADILSEAILLLDALVHQRPVAETRLQEVLLSLRKESGGAPSPSAMKMPATAHLDQDLVKALTAAETRRLQRCFASKRDVFLISCQLPVSEIDSALPDIEKGVSAHGQHLATIPGAPGEFGRIDFHLLVSDSLPETLLARFPEDYRLRVRLVFSPRSSQDPATAQSPSPVSVGASAHAVRIDSDRLNALLDMSKNLLLQQGQLKKLYKQCLRDGATHASEVLERSFQDMERGLIRLQRSLNDARMVQAGFLFQRMKRVVRAAERRAGKQVRLVMHGNEVVLDRLVLEQLHEPLMHLVRNAVDHGIEPLTERRTLGKEAEGSVHLEAWHYGGQVTIRVRDDGRGVDLAKVRDRASALGIIRAGEALSDQQLFDLLFTPGFSTREDVSEVSGRGVGMDVVRSQLDSLGGLVTIDSRPGAGTAVTLTLPVHKAIMPVLLANVAGRSYAIGLEMVDCVRPCGHESDEELVAGSVEDTSLLPRFDLRRHVLAPGSEGAVSPYFIDVRMGDERVVLLVDGLEGRREAVIRPFDVLLRQVPGFSGIAELVGGGPVLMLDPGYLTRAAVHGADHVPVSTVRECSEGGAMERSGNVGGRGAEEPDTDRTHVRHRVSAPDRGVDSRHYLSFCAGGFEYALDILDLVEIIDAEEWITLPNAPVRIGGALLWRDQVLPLFDLGTAGHVPDSGGVCCGTVLVCNCETLNIAIAVEQVGQMFHDSEARMCDSGSEGQPEAAPYGNGAVYRDGMPVPLLDLVALLDFSKEWNCVQEKDPYC